MTEAWSTAMQWQRLARRESRRIARRRGRMQDADDLEQEGLISLWRSAQAHQPALGTFSTFAIPALRHRLSDVADRAEHPLNPGRGVLAALRQLRGARRSLERAGRPTTRDALAEALDTSVERIDALEAAEAVRIERLDLPLDTDDGDGRERVVDRLASSDPSVADQAARWGEARRIRRALNTLPKTDRALLLGRVVEGRTLDSLAQLRGVPRSQIRDQLHHAQGELRKALGRVS